MKSFTATPTVAPSPAPMRSPPAVINGVKSDMLFASGEIGEPVYKISHRF
jgi:hypothetical protein